MAEEDPKTDAPPRRLWKCSAVRDMFLDENLILSNNHNNADVSIGHMLLSQMLLASASLNGAIMYSRNKFAALEAMCRERAALAKKEMDYWLSEAEEWNQLRESDPSRLRLPVQLDLCAALNIQVTNDGKCDWSNVPGVPQEA
jgi:hypothetical protein